MLQERIQEFDGLLRAWAGARWTADFRFGQSCTNPGDSVIVELEVFGRGSVPVDDVGLVPYFEVPGAHLLPAVALHEMFGELADELTPHSVILGRIVDGAGH